MNARATTSAQAALASWPSRVMIDGQNLMLKHGTGIATYTRSVIAALRGGGARVDALIESPFQPGPDGRSNRQRFEQQDQSLSRRLLDDRTRLYLNGILAKPSGLRAGPVSLQETTARGTAPSDLAFQKLAVADGGFAAHDLFVNARQHAIRWGKLLPVRMKEGDRPDLFHAMQIAPIQVEGRPAVVTVHDIIPLALPGSTRENLRHFSAVVAAILRNADHVVTVSEHSRRDLIKTFGCDERRITNTYQPVDVPAELVARSEIELDDDVAFYGLERDSYFLFLGAIEPKKNVRRLVEAFGGSGSRRTLALVGGLGWDYEDDLRAIDDPRFHLQRRDGDVLRGERQVRRLSYVPRPQLISLIRGARAVLFPSLYEGFGLPALEALALGAPAMTSNVSSLPEIVGEAALMVDPYDTHGMAKAIRQLDRDDDLVAELRRRGPIQASKFGAAAHAERLAAVYRQVL